jgi:pimeloyl-ACP methyl ester carboxylesterase
MTSTTPRTGYAPVNGMQMYYEIHGHASGVPLLLLHGAFMTVEGYGPLLPALAATRRVIAVEMQGHGRTADVDRPLTLEQLASDAAALLRHLGIDRADVFGYSIGAGVALQLAIRYPALVRKLVFVSGTFNNAGFNPGVLEGIATLTPELFAGTPMEADYRRLAPNPENFPALVTRIIALDSRLEEWPAETIQSLEAPTLIVIGDSDGTRPEHAVEMFRLLGGGVFGDVAGLPTSQLAILPGTTHVGVIYRTDWLASMTAAFLDQPMPDD